MSSLATIKGDIYSLLTALTWSIAVIYYRLAGFYLETVPLKVLQNFVAVVLFFISAVVMGEPLWLDLDITSWGLIIASGLIGITLADTWYIAAIRRLGAGAQAIIDCLYSPFVILLAFLFFAEILTQMEAAGAVLILIAVFLATFRPISDNTSRQETRVGLIYGVLSQLAMALTVVLVRDLLRQDSVITIMMYRYLVGNVALIAVFSLRKERHSLWQGFRWNIGFKWNFLGAVLGPYLATLFWFLGFKYTLAGRAAIYNQLSSIFIIVLATLFLREPLTKEKTFAILLATIGGLLVGWN